LIGRDLLAIGQLTGSTHGTVLRLTGLADKPCFEGLFGGAFADAGCLGRDLRHAVRRGKDKLSLPLSFMANHPSNSLKPGWAFPGWFAALNADASLSPGLRASYRQTVSRFLAFCAKRRTGPSVAAYLSHLATGGG
jgi:hypothetical protein